MQWTVIYVWPEFILPANMENSNGLATSRVLGLCAAAVICSLAIVVHQFLSLKTSRSIIALPLAILACVIVMDGWRVDFVTRAEPPVDHARFDPGPVSLAIEKGQVSAQPFMRGPREPRMGYERIVAELAISGVPSDAVAEPTKVDSQLNLPGEVALHSQLDAGPASLPFEPPVRSAPDRNRAILNTLGQFTWTNLDSTYGRRVGTTLIDVPDTIYRKHEGAPGALNAEITLHAVGFHPVAVMPVRVGEGFHHSPNQAEIVGVDHIARKWLVRLREVSESGCSFPLQAWDLSLRNREKYVLVNRTSHQALYPEADFALPAFSDDLFMVFDSCLNVTRRLLTFSVPQASAGPYLDSAWLAQAELVRVEPVSLGVFTKPLKVDNFVLPALR